MRGEERERTDGREAAGPVGSPQPRGGINGSQGDRQRPLNRQTGTRTHARRRSHARTLACGRPSLISVAAAAAAAATRYDVFSFSSGGPAATVQLLLLLLRLLLLSLLSQLLAASRLQYYAAASSATTKSSATWLCVGVVCCYCRYACCRRSSGAPCPGRPGVSGSHRFSELFASS